MKDKMKEIEKLIAIASVMRPDTIIKVEDLRDDWFRDILIRAILSKSREDKGIQEHLLNIFDENCVEEV